MSDQELEVYIEQLKKLKPDMRSLPIANCEARLDILIGLLEELWEWRLVAPKSMMKGVFYDDL